MSAAATTPLPPATAALPLAGLAYLLQVIPGKGIGTVAIYSQRGIVSFNSDGAGGVTPTVSRAVGFCPGTLIEIEIQTSAIQPVDEEEDLQW